MPFPENVPATLLRLIREVESLHGNIQRIDIEGLYRVARSFKGQDPEELISNSLSNHCACAKYRVVDSLNSYLGKQIHNLGIDGYKADKRRTKRELKAVEREGYDEIDESIFDMPEASVHPIVRRFVGTIELWPRLMAARNAHIRQHAAFGAVERYLAAKEQQGEDAKPDKDVVLSLVKREIYVLENQRKRGPAIAASQRRALNKRYIHLKKVVFRNFVTGAILGFLGTCRRALARNVTPVVIGIGSISICLACALYVRRCSRELVDSAHGAANAFRAAQHELSRNRLNSTNESSDAVSTATTTSLASSTSSHEAPMHVKPRHNLLALSPLWNLGNDQLFYGTGQGALGQFEAKLDVSASGQVRSLVQGLYDCDGIVEGTYIGIACRHLGAQANPNYEIALGWINGDSARQIIIGDKWVIHNGGPITPVSAIAMCSGTLSSARQYVDMCPSMNNSWIVFDDPGVGEIIRTLCHGKSSMFCDFAIKSSWVYDESLATRFIAKSEATQDPWRIGYSYK